MLAREEPISPLCLFVRNVPVSVPYDVGGSAALLCVCVRVIKTHKHVTICVCFQIISSSLPSSPVISFLSISISVFLALHLPTLVHSLCLPLLSSPAGVSLGVSFLCNFLFINI